MSHLPLILYMTTAIGGLVMAMSNSNEAASFESAVEQQLRTSLVKSPSGAVPTVVRVSDRSVLGPLRPEKVMGTVVDVGASLKSVRTARATTQDVHAELRREDVSLQLLGSYSQVKEVLRSLSQLEATSISRLNVRRTAEDAPLAATIEIHAWLRSRSVMSTPELQR